MYGRIGKTTKVQGGNMTLCVGDPFAKGAQQFRSFVMSTDYRLELFGQRRLFFWFELAGQLKDIFKIETHHTPLLRAYW